jgi:transposase
VYPSSVMLKIIIMGYKDGLNSSRRIDIACETSILFMSVSDDIQPHSWTKCMSILNCCSR